MSTYALNALREGKWRVLLCCFILGLCGLFLGLGFVTFSLGLRFVFLGPWMSCLDPFCLGLAFY